MIMEYSTNFAKSILVFLVVLRSNNDGCVSSTSIDCSQYVSCTECTIRAQCAWSVGSDTCDSRDDADTSQTWINEAPGCPDNDPVTILSFGTNEMIKYSMEYIGCSLDVSSVEEADALEFTDEYINDVDNENCHSTTVDSTFWVKESDDDTMSYQLLGRVDRLEDEAPCHLVIKDGTLTSITCPSNSKGIDDESGKDHTSTTLYGALKLLLPRTERSLFDENSDVSDEDGKGYVKSNRRYNNGYLERDFDFNCFDDWESDFVPESMNHYETAIIDDESNHVINADSLEKFIFKSDENQYSVYYVKVKLTMNGDIVLVDSSIIDELMNLLYTGNSDDYNRKEISLDNWYKGQYSDDDYNLHIVDEETRRRMHDEYDEEEKRRRMLHIDPLATYHRELYESPTIFGQTFSVELDASVGIDCLWDWLPGQSLGTVTPVLPVCWPLTGTCLWDTFGPLAIIPIFDCCNDFFRDLTDCDVPMHEVAEDDLVSCINGYPGAATCANIQQNFNDLTIYDLAAFLGINLDDFLPDGVTIGDFNIFHVLAQVYLKSQYCQINCVDGGGITGGVTLSLLRNGNTIWDYTVPFDKTAEFEIGISTNLFGINIPTGVPGVSVELEFDFDATVGLAYNEYNSVASDGSGDISYNEEAVPYGRLDLIFQAGLEISVIFASFEVFGEGVLTVLDFSYTLRVELVGFVSNPFSIPNPQIHDDAVWQPISFSWSVQWEVCFEINIGPIDIEIACEGGTIFRRRRQLSLLSPENNNNNDNNISLNKWSSLHHANRLLLQSHSEPGRTDNFFNLNFGSIWILEEGDPVYNVKAELCFQIIANDDLEDYIMFNDISNAIFSIGVTREWVSQHITLVGTVTIVYLNGATISVTPNTNAQNEDGNDGCDDGLPFEIYVESTMCLDLRLVTRFESDINNIQHRLDTSSDSKEYFLEQLSLLLLDISSPYAQYIQSIDTSSGVGNVMSLGTELYGETPPTPEPTLLPTMSPTLYNPIIECNNSPCDCGESDLNCKICHYPEGCDQCEDGYFKSSYSHKCQDCQTVFGDGCIQCQDFNGCGQCKDGWLRLYDGINDLWYCEEDASTHVDDDWRFDRIPTCQCPYECNNNPCSCGELEHCKKCAYNGCDECESGYFKKDYNSPCLQCQETFGDSCMFCQDFNGCGQCTNGYQRLYDSACGLWYCKQN